MQSWFAVYFSDIGHPCYYQLTLVKTRYPLTRIVTILQVQVYSLSRSHLFLKLTTDQLLVFHWIVGSCLINLLKTGQEYSEGG